MTKRPENPKRKTCCLLAAGAAIGIVGLIGLLALSSANVFLSGFSEGQNRAKVARVMSDMKEYETALQKYKEAHDKYPPWSDTAPPLTTPVSYLPFSMAEDPFSKAPPNSPGKWLHYIADDTNIIIWSVGPDGISSIIDADLDGNADHLKLKTYDATNGSISAGDLIRSTISHDQTIKYTVR